jgi:hypothetical protein
MGNPYIEHAQSNLDASTQMPTLEHQATAIAAAGAQAQMAVAYELHTIGRILALNAEITRHDSSEESRTIPGYIQNNAIVERLGL